MNNTEIGIALLIAAGLMNASFTLPMKFTRRWAWENTWLAWTFFTLLLLPAVVALCTVPGVVGIYRASDITLLWTVMIFGFGWGLSQVFFGIAVETIGIALTFSLVLGTSAATGALIPMFRVDPHKLHTTAGHLLLLGVATVLLGVALCGVAGRMRECAKLVIACQQRSNQTVGLLLAILCGCGASFLNCGLAFGTPLMSAAVRNGATSANAGDAIWPPLLVSGAIPNALYCLYLLKRNSTGRNFARGGFSHWFLALVMAVCWFGSVLFYGISASELGPMGTTVGWPLFMSLIVIAASLLGIVAGEWKRSGLWPLTIQLTGVAALVLAAFILAKATLSFA
jgi:L-rhamnose-H+ transport protein